MNIEEKMFEALKLAKWCFDEELRGREVDDAKWRECYAACSDAIETKKAEDDKPKGVKRESGRSIASGRTTRPE